MRARYFSVSGRPLQSLSAPAPPCASMQRSTDRCPDPLVTLVCVLTFAEYSLGLARFCFDRLTVALRRRCASRRPRAPTCLEVELKQAQYGPNIGPKRSVVSMASHDAHKRPRCAHSTSMFPFSAPTPASPSVSSANGHNQASRLAAVDVGCPAGAADQCHDPRGHHGANSSRQAFYTLGDSLRQGLRLRPGSPHLPRIAAFLPEFSAQPAGTMRGGGRPLNGA
ncbi:uncharacterized protein C8Q71DRAFT_243923 [Rhodofomes roseus]|uniref:Uncharacterized protein n=1 Tax=Rhodofomes roseus TaxID=34475 RepID=A0ABQ8K792_9APHY|nr:uncharacterized protein C8Q71DRAFT_243923 [Rhodofomes roseus]KAH9832912.1 hypothetical protein C8Q71DRAFT_243923 [Rhodofomes roseus]